MLLHVATLVLLSSVAFAEDNDFYELESVDSEVRTIFLNSTFLAYGVAIGAVFILVFAVGLYLYDYYYGTSRADTIPQDQLYYNQYYADQGQYGQYAYANQANQANYR